MITIKDLCKDYGEVVLYKNFNITFESQRVTALLGASGCGKTTLLRLLAGLEQPDSGEILGLERDRLAFIFQEDRLIEWLSVYDNLAFVLKSYCTPQVMKEKIEKILVLLELEAYRDAMPQTLSGGMRRRVALGRAFVYDCSCILMDEPFKGLDEALKKRLLQDIKKLWEHQPKTVIFVTHQQEEATWLADCTYVLEGIPVGYRVID